MGVMKWPNTKSLSENKTNTLMKWLSCEIPFAKPLTFEHLYLLEY